MNATPRAIVVMGVSGTGKSMLGAALAARLGWRFIEGDKLHPATNIAKMASGIPLDDSDRWPWLAEVGANLYAAAAAGGGVVACSALRKGYRDLLRARLGPGLRFVLPVLEEAALLARMAMREGHYMPPELLASQCATLELPTPEEHAILVPGDMAPEAQVSAVLAALA